MTPRYRGALITLLATVLCAASLPASAQSNRIVPVEDWSYTLIHRLQRRGFLLDLHPTALPYTHSEVVTALSRIDRSRLRPRERRWIQLLESEFAVHPNGDKGFVFRGELEGQATVIDSDRMDVLRPLGDEVNLFEHVLVRTLLEKGPFVVAAGLRHDIYYDEDPDGLDTALRFMIRNQDAYAGYRSRLASVYIGRYHHHWGIHGRAGPLISSNPRSYDNLAIRFGGDRFVLRTVLGELDAITAEDEFNGRAGDKDDGKNRYLAAHRFDWRPSRRFVIGAQQVSLYSGQGAHPSLKYLNPAHQLFFLVDNIPKSEENNGFLSGHMWLHTSGITLFGQIVADDFDSINAVEPASVTVVGSLMAALGGIDVGLDLEVISSRSYNTEQAEGRYLYLLRGLGTQFADYVLLAAYSDLYLDQVAPGLTLSPKLSLLLQGEEGLINRPYPDDSVPFVLAGTTLRTLRSAIGIEYQRSRNWWLSADFGINHVSNDAFIEGEDTSRFSGRVTLGLRVTGTGASALTFKSAQH